MHLYAPFVGGESKGMEPKFFRDFARRVRHLMPDTRTEATRQQLAMWADEFEQRAETMERELRRAVSSEAKSD